MRAALIFALGALVGVGGAIAFQRYTGPTTFEECFLTESQGRQKATFQFVRKVCRARFPEKLLTDQDIWGP